MTNQNILEGKWRQFKGDIQVKWGKITNDKLDQIDGNREKFLGAIQESYGLAREQAEKDLNDWEKRTASSAR